MPGMTVEISWIAVVTATAASYLLGWLWYSPILFGSKWAEGVGVQLGSAGQMPAAAMIIQLAGTFLLAWLVGLLISAGLTDILLLLTLSMTLLMISSGYYSNKNNHAVVIESSYFILMVAVMATIHSVL